MEKILFKEIVKLILVIVCPLIIISLIFINKQHELVIAFIIGVLLGVLRLKALFRYIISKLDKDKLNESKLSLVKYLASLVFALGTIVFILMKSMTIGLAILGGLLTVPIIVMIYSMAKGISIFSKK